ncbi:hypothetical protein [Blastococcus sp. SYSU DS1024]
MDTGPPGSGPAIRAALHHLGVPPEELHQIVLTRLHDDHAGSAACPGRGPAAAGLTVRRSISGAGRAGRACLVRAGGRRRGGRRHRHPRAGGR